MTQRQTNPVYVNCVIQGDRLELNLEGRYWQEQADHKKNHISKYIFYNNIFGNRREKINARQRERYWKDPEYRRQLSRESYARRHPKKQQSIDERFMPACRLQCEECQHPDCILPHDWLKKAYAAEFLAKHPDYFKQYRLEHAEERKDYERQRYQQKKPEILKRQKEHRQKPEVKAKRAEYDRQYRKAHPESAKLRKKRYAEAHPDRVRAQKRAYYAAHKDEINARRREIRRELRTGNENSSHCEM